MNYRTGKVHCWEGFPQSEPTVSIALVNDHMGYISFTPLEAIGLGHALILMASKMPSQKPPWIDDWM